tara:strand:- start:722 stop:877 length:156 start_codon:yes stop_codon:yes gene_type:complete
VNENTHHAKYLSWIDIHFYKKISKPMAIIGIVCTVLGNFFEQVNKKALNLN